MKEGYILSIDLGTQSLRAIIFDVDGNVVESEKIKYNAYIAVNPGWAEKDPEEYWTTLCNAVKNIKKRNSKAVGNIIGIVVTALRNSYVNLDKNGDALRTAILWLDQRQASGKPNLLRRDKLALKLMRMEDAINILYRKGKSNWIIQNQKNIWDKTHKYLQVSGFINYRLTGDFVDSSASQIGHIPLDYKNKKWITNQNDMKWRIFNITIDKCAKLVEPTGLIGNLCEKAAKETSLKKGTPVFSGGSDKGCETLGVGCINDDFANLSFGTSATIQTMTKKYYEAVNFIPPYPAVIPDMYNPEIQIERGYWLISWFKREFSKKECQEAKSKNISPEDLLNQRLNAIPPGCRGLILQPNWSPGVLTPKAKGSIIGFGDVHDHAHVYRAIIEGINFALMTGLNKIQKKSGKKIKTLMVAGGGSQSDEILQITSDMFNLPVKRPENFEASALGAAIIGFIAAEKYSNFNEAVSNMVRHEKTFYPNKKNYRIYKDLYNNVYVRIGSKLKSLYDEIQSITHYPEI